MIRKLWPQVLPLLHKLEPYYEIYYDDEDILDNLLTNHFQLWLYIEEKKIKAFLITTMIEYPKAKVLQYLFCAGTNLRVFQTYDYLIRDWAEAHGASRFEVIGRKGWARVMNADRQMTWTGGKIKE